MYFDCFYLYYLQEGDISINYNLLTENVIICLKEDLYD